MKFPIYKLNSIFKNDDFNIISSADNVGKLCSKLYDKDLSVINNENSIREFIDSAKFNDMATGGMDEASKKAFTVLIRNIHDIAKSFGFPYKPQTKEIFDFDKQLAKYIYEILEEKGKKINPAEISNVEIQRFMTQRIFPLVVHWRWYSQDKNKISGDRINHGSRNYFFTLMMIAWLCDQGRGSGDRWALMEALNADITVAIIERPGSGFRRGFFHALAKKLILHKNNHPRATMSTIARGIMKRATLTFSVTAMIDDEQFYTDIVEYLFNWSEKNYRRNNNSDYNLENNESLINSVVDEEENDDVYFDEGKTIPTNIDSISNLLDDIRLNSENTEKQEINLGFVYLKKLNGNELGYRNGVVAGSRQCFYISKEVANYFPLMNKEIKNHKVEITVEYGSSFKTKLNYTYHNDKHNTVGGTRDELRIYLNQRISQSDQYHFRPDDIIVFERKSYDRYKLKQYRKDEKIYKELNLLIRQSKIRGGHALVPAQKFRYLFVVSAI